MKNTILRDNAKQFAINVINLIKEIRNNTNDFVLTNQLLKSSTSIGANIHEAYYAQGTLDFISKLEIALKECYESEYWLELLFETNYISENDYKILSNDCGRIRQMLISSCKTAKGKL